MVARLAAFVIWAAVAASAVYWGLQLWVRPSAAPEHAAVVSAASGFSGDLRLVLGEDAPPPVATGDAPVVRADARYRLIGVVAPRSSGPGAQGIALIATDGKPPKAYRVGAAVDGELVLLAVHGRGASLGPPDRSSRVELQLPALPPPATGTPAGLAPRPSLPQLQTPRPPPVPQAAPAVPTSPMPAQSTEIDADTDAPAQPGNLPPPGGIRPPTLPPITHTPTRPPT
jgi:general secretion pathway protein C